MAAGITAETLEVLYKGKSIADVLDMTADEAVEFFENLPKIRRKVADAGRSGPGLYQAGPALHAPSPAARPSGCKLATELSQAWPRADASYILDEPTTGLHIVRCA